MKVTKQQTDMDIEIELLRKKISEHIKDMTPAERLKLKIFIEKKISEL